MNKNEWYFVFLTAPQVPVMVCAIYPKTQYEQALIYTNNGNGYLTLRKAVWEYGSLPEYNETDNI